MSRVNRDTSSLFSSRRPHTTCLTRWKTSKSQSESSYAARGAHARRWRLAAAHRASREVKTVDGTSASPKFEKIASIGRKNEKRARSVACRGIKATRGELPVTKTTVYPTTIYPATHPDSHVGS